MSYPADEVAIEAIEDDIAALLRAALLTSNRVYTPRQSYEPSPDGINVRVSYTDSTFTQTGCIRQRTARIHVEYECPEELIHTALAQGLAALDSAIPAGAAGSQLEAKTESIDRTGGILIGVQQYEILLF